MKKVHISKLLMVLLVSVAVISCSKDEEGDNNNGNQSNNPGGVVVPDGKGILVAVKTVTYTEVPGFGLTEATVNAASAAFWESSPSSFVNVGTVKINDLPLDFESNSKTYYSGQAAVNSLQFPPVKWEVSGTGSIPAFTKEISSSFPDFSGNFPATVSNAEDITISLSGKIANADSVFVGVFADAKSQFKIVSANTASVTFSKSELSSLGTIRQVQVTPIKYIAETVSGTKLWFILEEGNTRIYNIMPGK
ncbi:MAG: hypothetical protein ACP5O2_02110 [Bacteroidales bacterium]